VHEAVSRISDWSEIPALRIRRAWRGDQGHIGVGSPRAGTLCMTMSASPAVP